MHFQRLSGKSELEAFAEPNQEEVFSQPVNSGLLQPRENSELCPTETGQAPSLPWKWSHQCLRTNWRQGASIWPAQLMGGDSGTAEFEAQIDNTSRTQQKAGDDALAIARKTDFAHIGSKEVASNRVERVRAVLQAVQH